MKKSSRFIEEIGFTLPSAVWLLIFFLIPTLIVFAFTFKAADLYGGLQEGWSLQTLKSLFSHNYAVLLWRTLWLSGVTTVLCLSFAIPVAYYLARASQRIRQFMLILIIMPFWSSFLVRIFAWKSLLNPEGMFKKILVALAIIDPDTSLLYNSGTVVLVMVYTYLPFAIIPLYATSSKFNFQLCEAAMDLGATRFKTFTKIFLPGIRKGILTALLMVFIPALGAYVIPDLVGGTQSEMIGNKIAQRSFVDRNLPLASALSAALALIVLIPMAVTTLIQSRVKKLGKVARGKE
jgi:spermidine/putrescine transport system permease protein